MNFEYLSKFLPLRNDLATKIKKVLVEEEPF